MKRLILSLICLLFLSEKLLAQDNESPHLTPNTFTHTLTSSIVANQIYKLSVALPDSYHSNTNNEYPIIFVLDGQWNFTLVKDISGKLAYDGMIPQVITVGITWGGENDDPSILRFRDFLRPEIPFLPMSGGADLFLTALTEELVPFVQQNYRTNGKKVLLGTSLGGLFTTFAMVEKKNFFDGYLSIAGSFFADGIYIEEKLFQMSRSDELKGVRSFMAVGSLDSNSALVQTMHSAIKEAHLKGFKHKSKTYKGVGHAGVEPIAYTYGLQYLFQRPQLKLSEEFLQRYIGEYEGGPEGAEPSPITVSTGGTGKLIIGNTFQSAEYLAESETRFYINGVNVSVEFLSENSFILNSQGTTLTFNRIE